LKSSSAAGSCSNARSSQPVASFYASCFVSRPVRGARRKGRSLYTKGRRRRWLHRKPFRPFGYRLLNEAVGRHTVCFNMYIGRAGKRGGLGKRLVTRSKSKARPTRARRVTLIFPPRSGFVQEKSDACPLASRSESIIICLDQAFHVAGSGIVVPVAVFATRWNSAHNDANTASCSPLEGVGPKRAGCLLGTRGESYGCTCR